MGLREEVMLLVLQEQQRQDEKWGEQNHPDGTTDDHNAVARANQYRDLCNANARLGRLTWADIAREEFYELLAETDPAKLQAEIVQCAAVLATWYACITRRQEAAGTLHEQPGKDGDRPLREAIQDAIQYGWGPQQ